MSQRMITQANSRLTKENVAAILTKEEAWSSLDEKTQRELYRLIPAQFRKKMYLHDHTVHPMKTQFAKYIKHFIYEWEQDLANGHNTARWNQEARLASGERAAGAFDYDREGDRMEKLSTDGSTTVPNTSIAASSHPSLPDTMTINSIHDSAMEP